MKTSLPPSCNNREFPPQTGAPPPALLAEPARDAYAYAGDLCRPFDWTGSSPSPHSVPPSSRHAMAMTITLREATSRDAQTIVALVQSLFDEITDHIGYAHLPLSVESSISLLESCLEDGRYTVLLAEVGGDVVGCLSLVGCVALYMEGAFGIVHEFFVQPHWRSLGIGRQLLAEATRIAARRGWRCLELTTPPLPEFDRTLAFYQECGFVIAGGRKMKRMI